MRQVECCAKLTGARSARVPNGSTHRIDQVTEYANVLNLPLD